MSEEEIIKDVVEIVELAKEEIQNNDENITVILDLQDLKSLKGLLDLYQKEKEKNKELKTLLENNLMYSHYLEKDLFENCSNYVISKDKIKAIIKDLEEFNEHFYDTKTLKLAFKNSLQQLLEEGENNV